MSYWVKMSCGHRFCDGEECRGYGMTQKPCPVCHSDPNSPAQKRYKKEMDDFMREYYIPNRAMMKSKE